MSEQKKYIGKGKEIGQYGMIKFGFKLEELQKHASQTGWVNIVIGNLKQVDDKGNTHTAWIDDWKPDPNRQPQQRQDTVKNNHVQQSFDDWESSLPF